uniref:Uncharacterized protein n=1 Tax=Panagrolaimus sp. PS1159 TaxID=55785 RepID=A0AC35FQ42_9BILA
MLPTCMKTSSVHNVNHLYMEMDEWINCTSTPTTLNCFAQFPILRDPIVLSEFMSYKIESDGRLNTNKFLYAEIDNFINETKIIGGIPYNENCVHLNNPYESRKYIISTTLCCQEYF